MAQRGSDKFQGVFDEIGKIAIRKRRDAAVFDAVVRIVQGNGLFYGADDGQGVEQEFITNRLHGAWGGVKNTQGTCVILKQTSAYR
jgi:hypothetical protein